MRAFVVVLMNEAIETSLLSFESRLGWSRRLRLERSVHSLVSAILFRMTGNDSFDGDAETDPPQRKSRQPRQAWRSERAAVVREDRTGKSVRSEYAFEATPGVALFV